jgi:spore maturation protein CgeB
MKIVRLHYSGYPTSKFYEEDIENITFLECLRKVYSNRVYWSDAFSDAFSILGAQAIDLIANDKRLQLKWAEENLVTINPVYWKIEVIIAQLRTIKPDVVIFQNFEILPDEIIKELKKWIKSIKILAVQIGYPRDDKDLSIYDILFPTFKYIRDKYFHSEIPMHICKPAFDSRVLSEIQIPKEKEYPISFLGSSGIGYGCGHSKRYWMLYDILKKTEINVHLDENRSQSHLKNHRKLYIENPNRNKVLSDEDFNTVTNILDQEDTFEHQTLLTDLLSDRILREALFAKLEPLVPLKFMFHDAILPPVYGKEYYELISKSFSILNIHTDAIGHRVGNMRMFETTGVGSCLLVENGSNMSEFFDKDKEVVTYENLDDCLEKINFLSNNLNVAIDIGKSGQRKTLKDHTVANRCELILGVLNEYL